MGKINLVCLDTSIIKNILYDDGDIAKEFEKIKNEQKVRFRVAETTYAEILADLIDKSIPFEVWNSKIDLLNSFIDQDRPIQEQGYNLSVSMKSFKIEKPFKTLYKREYWVKVWKHITTSKNIDSLTTTIVYYHEHKPYQIRIKEDLIEPAFDDSRREWYKYYEDVKRLAKNETLKEIIEIFSHEFEQDYNLEKMGDFIHVLSNYTFKFKSDKNFNPYSDKRRNDSIDFSFIQLLAMPAIFCTNDKKFYNFVQNTDAPNKANLMLGEDVIKYFHNTNKIL